MQRRRNPPREVRAQRVIAVLERSSMKQPVRPISTPLDAVNALADYIGNRASEVFVVLHIGIRNHIVGFTEFSEGSVSGVTVNPTGIFKDALLANASAIVTAHQHPSGDPTPSAEDRMLWRRLKAAGEVIGIPVMDNLVIGESSFYSESEDGITSYAGRLKP